MKYKYSEYYQLVARESTIEKVKINDSKDVYNYAKEMYSDGSIAIHESFYLIMLNNKNVTKGYKLISTGGITGTLVDITILAKYAIDSLCKAVVLVHNHPSGDTEPSRQDIELTKRVDQALKLFDIKVLDHTIIAEDKYYSFADNGML